MVFLLLQSIWAWWWVVICLECYLRDETLSKGLGLRIEKNFLMRWIDTDLLICLYRFAAIHAEAPEFVEMSVEQEILVTGIKVVDLLAPYAKGGKIGMLSDR